MRGEKESMKEEISDLMKKHEFLLVEKAENLYNSRYVWKNFETSELVILELNRDYEDYFKAESIINE